LKRLVELGVAMEINHGSKKMQQLCSDEQAMRDAWGDEIARKLRLRLTEIEAADSLEDLQRLPQAGCQLHPSIRGRLSVALAGPLRLVFEADDEPLPVGDGGGLDWGRVTCVRVLDVSGPVGVLKNKGEGDVEEALRA
jgi:plasmid maintenance system killer protein